MRRLAAVMTAFALLAGTARAADLLKEAPKAAPPTNVGRLVDDLAFTDSGGKSRRFSNYRDHKALVVCFTSATCPVAKKYAPRLAELAGRYQGQKVAFVVVNSPALAEALGARTTTEVFVLDAARTLLYRGAIDDQYGLGYSLPAPRRTYLIDAIDAVLAGRPIEVRSTTAPGCLIELPVKAAAAAPPPAVTYHNRISRILQNHCQECHRPGETAPFALLDYPDAKAHLKTIGREVQRGAMPPWFASPSHGGPWANDRSLSETDKADLLAWVKAGGPEGDPRDAPLPKSWQTGWQIGKPDAVFQPARTFKVKAQGTMPYQHVWVPTDLPEDKYVQSIEVRPSSPQHVHHVLVFLIYPRSHPRAAEQPDYRGGLRGYFAGMVPGQWATFFPRGTAKFLPKGGILMFQIHYTPNGTAAEDRPSVGLVFAKDKPQFELETKSAANSRFVIPPLAGNHEVAANTTFRVPTRIFSLMPHSHVRGKAFRYELISPAGEARTILDVPRYDFNWQLEYRLAEPLDVPAGSKLKVTGWYDNSKENPANPDPTKAVRFGEQTSDEMMIGYYTGHPLVKAPPATRPAR